MEKLVNPVGWVLGLSLPGDNLGGWWAGDVDDDGDGEGDATLILGDDGEGEVDAEVAPAILGLFGKLGGDTVRR